MTGIFLLVLKTAKVVSVFKGTLSGMSRAQQIVCTVQAFCSAISYANL